MASYQVSQQTLGLSPDQTPQTFFQTQTYLAQVIQNNKDIVESASINSYHIQEDELREIMSHVKGYPEHMQDARTAFYEGILQELDKFQELSASEIDFLDGKQLAEYDKSLLRCDYETRKIEGLMDPGNYRWVEGRGFITNKKTPYFISRLRDMWMEEVRCGESWSKQANDLR